MLQWHLNHSSTNGSNAIAAFNCREATSNPPQLVIVQTSTITFPTLATKTLGIADFSPSATASTGLSVSYTSSNTSVATIVNGNIHLVGAGTSVITASQAGDGTNNAAASVTQTLTVSIATNINSTNEMVKIGTFRKTINCSEIGTIKVYNLQGEQVAYNENSNRLNTNLITGLYIIHFSNKNGQKTIQKIIIE
ncbi:MAG: T9SS type A sorting domain-containing protein [Paludibacter sp.]